MCIILLLIKLNDLLCISHLKNEMETNAPSLRTLDLAISLALTVELFFLVFACFPCRFRLGKNAVPVGL